MAINISNATAICHDCHKPVANGPLILDLETMIMGGRPVVMEGKSYMITLASGLLVGLCAKHHDLLRDPGNDNLPKHDTFRVQRGGEIIGEFSPPASVSEVSIKITNNEIREQLLVEARIINRERVF